MHATHPMTTTDASSVSSPAGEPLAAYKGRTVSTILIVLLGLGILGFGGWLIVFPALFINFNNPVQVWTYLLLAVPAGLALMLLGGWMARVSGRNLGLRIIVHANGLERRQFGRRSFWPWDEIETVWYNANSTYLQGIRPAAARYELVRRDGKRLIFNWFLAGLEKLGLTIEAEVVPRRLPERMRAFEAGEDVVFGPLTVRKEGLVQSNRVAPWPTVGSATLVDGGKLLIKTDDGWTLWYTCWMSKVPDLMLFFAMLGEVLKKEGTRALAPEELAEVEVAPLPLTTESADGGARNLDAGLVWDFPDRVPAYLVDPLGPPMGVCPYSPTTVRAGMIVSLVFAVLSGLGVVLMLCSFLEGNAKDRTSMQLVGLLCAGGFLIPAGLCYWDSRRKQSDRLVVFREGFVEVLRGRATFCRWDRIDRVYQTITRMYLNGAYTGTMHTYGVLRDDGKKFELTSQFQNIERFGEYLLNIVHRRLLAKARQEYREVGTVDFGSLQVTREGIGHAWAAKLPWGRYGGHTLHAGSLYLYLKDVKGPHTSYPLGSIANPYVLLDLVQDIQTGKVV